MVANPSKFQFMCMSMGRDYELCIEIDKIVTTTVEQVKIVDSKLKFDAM